MARNLRPGPDWLPCTIVEVLGLVTYIVEMEDGQCWKRHPDQLKSWLSSLPTARSEPGSDSVSQQMAEDFPTEPTELTEESSVTETPEPTEEPPTPSDSSPLDASEMVALRYPQPNRRPPDRYS